MARNGTRPRVGRVLVVSVGALVAVNLLVFAALSQDHDHRQRGPSAVGRPGLPRPKAR
ncbi:MAG: hypothetical protein KatS3mg010_1018 [Acidimicrobiia bacterium]|nr:MAG: hypothetical protein KatS3mg010_1018 [Acidimicrobiia bacterium]